MRLIKEITEHIHEEMEGICSYIKFASKIKSENEYIFDTLLEIIPQEIKHVEIWHDVAVREINKMKTSFAAQGKEVPAYMLEMWQDEHEEYIEKMANIRYKLDLLKKPY
jgi:hypothetical protein